MNLKEKCPTLTFPFNRFKQFQGLGGPLYKNQNNIDPPPPLLIYTQLMWPIFKNKYQHFIVLLILTNKGSNSKYLNTRKCIFTWMKEEKSLFDVYVFENEYACSSVYFQIPIVAFLNKGLSKTISTGRMQHFPFNSWSNHTHVYIIMQLTFLWIVHFTHNHIYI